MFADDNVLYYSDENVLGQYMKRCKVHLIKYRDGAIITKLR